MLPGPKGSDAIEHNYAEFFKSEDLPTGETAFDGRSDYLAFITVGIPSGGLFSGAEEIKTKKEQKLYGGKAGKPYDACYHAKCDDIDNVSKKSLDPMADAVADSIMTYAFNLSALKSGGSDKAASAKSAAATRLLRALAGPLNREQHLRTHRAAPVKGAARFMPEAGVEPACPEGQCILSASRMPFRHSGVRATISFLAQR